MGDWDRAMDRDYVPASFDIQAGPHFIRCLDSHDHEAAQHLRVMAKAARIATETEGREAVTKSTRGTKQRIACLTSMDPATRRPRQFRSVSDAGRFVDRLAHHVRRAILRGGWCGGHRWAYVGPDGKPVQVKTAGAGKHKAA